MKKSRKIIFSALSLLMCVLLLTACTPKAVEEPTENAQEVMAQQTETKEEPTTQEPTTERKPDSKVNILAVGDNLIHAVIYNQAHARANGNGYDFSYAYKNIADTIKKADLSIINQETIIDPTRSPATYPCFNSPVELGEEMVRIGFDVFNLANNHSLDMGEKGLRNAIKFWDEQGVVHCGAYLNKEEYKKIPSNTVNDIKFSYVGLTDPTNGLSLKDGAETVLMLGENEDMIKERIQAASKMSDVVIVNVHWGVEYTHTPTDRQRDLAKKMASWGADIIIGNHPHVIQPVEYIKNDDGSQTLCIYSLGNFISAQDRGARMLGGMMHITVTKDGMTGDTKVTDAYFTGTVTHYDYNFSNVRVYNLSDYTPELAARHGVHSTTPEFSVDYLNNIVKNVIDKQFLKG